MIIEFNDGTRRQFKYYENFTKYLDSQREQGIKLHVTSVYGTWKEGRRDE